MMTYANLDSVMAWLKESIDGFGFHLAGTTGTTVGEECAEDIAIAIRERGLSEQRGARDSWPENSDNPPRRYKTWKGSRYGTDQTNFRTSISSGSMMSPESLKGEVTVDPHETLMQYGLGAVPSTSSTGYTCNDDFRRTDVEKARYANEQGRKFYDLDDLTNAPVLDRIGKALHEWLEQRNQ